MVLQRVKLLTRLRTPDTRSHPFPREVIRSTKESLENHEDYNVKIPPDAIIPDEKLTRYLLVPREQDNKSKFLEQAGFTADNPEQLKLAIRQLADRIEALENRNNEYGIFYRVEGQLTGANDSNLSVITIWLNRKVDGKFQFITLKPKKE